MRRILVNAVSVTPEKGGIKTFLTGLLAGLRTIDDGAEWIVLCTERSALLFEGPASDSWHLATIKSPLVTAPARIAFDQFALPGWVRRTRATHLFTPSNVATLWPLAARQVVVVQAPLAVRAVRRHAGSYGSLPAARRLYFSAALPRSLRVAAATVAVSRYLADRLIEDYPWAAPRISVIHEGVDLARFQPRVRGVPALTPPYILFASTLFPYKGAAEAIRAYARAGGRAALGAELVLAGRDPDGRQRPALAALAAAAGVAADVRMLGAVPHGDMPALYAEASAFVYPSSVETFGLPVLEAMACGVPTITSNRMCMPEIAGDAALVIDPGDEAALAAALTAAVRDPALRQRLVAAGLARVRGFAWERTARELLALFDRIDARQAAVR